MGYREDYFKEHKGVLGKYRCVRCGKWFSKKDIEIDHIVPQSKLKGMPKRVKNDMNNLQAMCRHCNRSKQDKMDNTAKDLAANVTKNTIKNIIKKIIS